MLRLNRLSTDAQTSDEAYYTLSSPRSIQNKTINDLIHKNSTTDSLSSIYYLTDCESMESNSDLLHEIAPQNLQLLPIITDSNDRSMELFREIMINGDSGERDFKEMVEEFVRLIEHKLSDTEIKIFDAK